MGNERQLSVDIGGRRYLIGSDDDYLEGLGETFEPETVELFRALVRPEDVALDVGANIGCTALLLAALGRQVHAFEPSPSTFAYLEKNVARSGLANVSLHNLALGAEQGEATLTFAPSNRSGGFLSDRSPTGSGHVSETVEIRRLDDVVHALGLDDIDFIKIDVEGFERPVIQGAARTLTRWRPVVALELNHWCLNAFQRTSVPDFFDFLRAAFPVLLAVDGRSFMRLHDADQAYVVMYHHIIQMRFRTIVAAFEPDRLRGLEQAYSNRFDG